jgi:hypothetical protein
VRVLLGALLASKPGVGGDTWSRLGWIQGFKELSVELVFVEHIDRDGCHDDEGRVTSFEESINRAWFRRVAEDFGFSDAAFLVYEHGEGIEGGTHEELLELAATCDLLVNISGDLNYEPVLNRARRKAFVDFDPVYTQAWLASGDPRADRLAGYDHYFTVGRRIANGGCGIPTGGVDWLPTRHPVVLSEWPVTKADEERFTTVGSWPGPFYGPLSVDGRALGQKADEFRKVVDLPRRAPQRFELALDIDRDEFAEDVELFESCGWSVTDAEKVAYDPHAFRRYVQDSGGEFSVAQGYVVELQAGWFSDRTACYLASGKPAIVQDAGTDIRADEGLLLFRTPDEAVAAAERVAADYATHAEAARAVAAEHLDAAKVVSRMLEDVGLA